MLRRWHDGVVRPGEPARHQQYDRKKSLRLDEPDSFSDRNLCNCLWSDRVHPTRSLNRATHLIYVPTSPRRRPLLCRCPRARARMAARSEL